ncbi:MAG: branched-chain amino acid ABC transporter permease [Acidimicrobiia bacterium]|nr:branched-chain amino acid ABC transporter permease [Acidimicrobiia bacterium]
MSTVGVILAQASSAETFITKLIDGLALGSIYAILALGFVIIFKSTQVLSFAHGAVAAVGAYLAAYFVTVINWPGRYLEGLPATLRFIISALVAVAAAAVIGMLIERVFIRPMIGQPLFSIAMITIGIDIVLRTIVGDLLGQGGTLDIGSPWGILSFTKIGEIVVPHVFIAAIVTVIIVVVALVIFFRTRMGVAMRATAFDQEAAMAQGISAGRIFALAWALGAVLAAIGGIFSSISPRGFGVTGGTAFFALRAFPAIIIGGLDSIVGAVVGGFTIGIAEIMLGHYLANASGTLGIGFTGLIPYLLMLGFLLVKPYGLFGTEEIRRL